MSVEEVAAAMWAGDTASQALGMALEHVADGYARVSMTVRDDMANGHGILHGGMLFALADTAFAFACNSHGVPTVAAQCSISFLAPGRLGDKLVAEAREIYREGRQGVTDVTVTRSDGTILGHFRGNSRTIGKAANN